MRCWKLKSTSQLARFLSGHVLSLIQVAESAKVEDCDDCNDKTSIISSEGEISVQVTLFVDGRVHVAHSRKRIG